jgi:hypothetical protein
MPAYVVSRANLALGFSRSFSSLQFTIACYRRSENDLEKSGKKDIIGSNEILAKKIRSK